MFGCFYVLHQHGLAVPNFSPEHSHWWYQLVFGACVAILVGTMGWLYESSRRRYQEMLSKQISSTREAVRSMKGELARFEEMKRGLMSTPLPFFLLDGTGLVLFANEAGKNLLERKMGERRDGSWYFSQEAVALFKEGVDRVRQKRGAATDEVFCNPLNAWYEAHVVPVGEGFLICLTDVTERKRTEVDLAQAKEKAEKEAALRKDRIAYVSRSARLMAMDMAGLVATIVSEYGDENPACEYTRLIEERSGHLLEMLDAVDELNWLESTGVRMQPVSVNVTEEAEQIVQAALPQAQHKGLHLWIESGHPQVTTWTDRRFLNRILAILLRTAIDHTDHGIIRVEVDEIGEDERSVVVRIKDTGAGIPEEMLLCLFGELRNEHDHAAPGASEQHEQACLHLSVVRRLVTLLGASLDIESSPGTGSTFSLVVPSLTPDHSGVGDPISSIAMT